MKKISSKMINNLHRKRMVILALVFLVIISLFIHVILYSGATKKGEVVAVVNGVSITYEQFMESFLKYKIPIFANYQTKYGSKVDQDKIFWTNSSYDGTPPIEVLKKKVMDKLSETTVKLLLAKQNYQIDKIDYKSMMKACNAENAKRNIAAENKQGIYGVINYDLSQYYQSTINRLMFNLKEKMKEKEFKASEADLKTYYEGIKDKQFKINDKLTLELITLKFYDANYQKENEQKQKYRAQIENARKEIESGKDFGTVAKANNKKMSDLELIYDATNLPKRDPVKLQLYNEAQKLTKGQISNIVETEESYCILKCVDRKVMGVKTFDEVKNNLGELYAVDRFDDFMSKQIKNASIQINKKIYDKIKVK